MNKVIACLLVALVLLGTALVMLNEQLTPREAPQQAQQTAPARLPDLSALADSGTQGTTPATRAQRTLPPLPDSLDLPGTIRAPVIDGGLPEAPAPDSTAGQATTLAAKPGGTRQEGEATGAGTAAPAQEPAPLAAAATAPARAAEEGVPARAQEAAAPAPRHETTARRHREARPERAARKDKRIRPAARPPKQCNVIVYVRDGGATVRLAGAEVVTYKQMILTQPDRVVLDLQGKWNVHTEGIPRNVLVGNVRIGHFPEKTRVVIDLHAKPGRTRFVQSKDRKRVDVRVDR